MLIPGEESLRISAVWISRRGVERRGCNFVGRISQERATVFMQVLHAGLWQRPEVLRPRDETTLRTIIGLGLVDWAHDDPLA